MRFDLDLKGGAGITAWTAVDSNNAFLALDRNGNGTIDDGSERFGDYTALLDGRTASNGWEALAEFDKPKNGGNSDGVIDNRDSIFPLLRLWIDKNHNGISEPDELYTLPQLGIEAIHLDYEPSRREDRFGNLFRYRARVDGIDVATRARYSRWAWDVFFSGTRKAPFTTSDMNRNFMARVLGIHSTMPGNCVASQKPR
jgi:hypothetical protein